MEGPQKRFWTHNLVSTTEDNQPANCAICRNLLSKICIECEVTGPQDIETLMKNDSKKLWMTLLLATKQPPLSTLPLNIIWKIYSFAHAKVQRAQCQVCTLYCNHNYHLHCFRRWLAKRESCPLCNSFQPRVDTENFYTLQAPTIQLVAENCYTSSEDFLAKKDFYERAEFASAFVVSFLKRFSTCDDDGEKAAWISQDILYEFYQRSPAYRNVGSLTKNRFITALQDVVRREFIEEKNGSYRERVP
jgi:hypothetical protein